MRTLASIAAILVVSVSPAAFAQDLTGAGTELKPGDEALVPHLVPKGPEAPIALTVKTIEEGDVADLSGFDIPAEMQTARPYYVHYSVDNVSDEDLSNQQIGGFVAIDAKGDAFMPSFTMGGAEPLEKCQDKTAADLKPGSSHEGCLLFMIEDGTDLAAIGYRGNYRYEEGVDTQKAFPIYYDPVLWLASTTSPETAKGGVLVTPKS